MNFATAPIALVIGYLLGAIPSGTIVARVYGSMDLTAFGSGRTGTTNVLRTLGPGAAAIVFLGDFFKGMLPVIIARQLSGGNPWVELMAAVGAVVGHTYSPFIHFKGGRGVTTGFGATAVAAPWLMLGAFALGLLLILATRYVSLGSMVGSTFGGLLMIGLAAYTREPAWALWGILLAGFIDVAHRDNVQRLLAGTERKLGEQAKSV